MDPRLEVILVILASFVIRIGIPLLVTALLVLFLGRLDARWKEEAGEFAAAKTGAETEARLAQTPCWEVHNCSAERRASCPAYAHQEVPCWQVFRSPTGALKATCLDCAVFRNAPLPLAAAD